MDAVGGEGWGGGRGHDLYLTNSTGQSNAVEVGDGVKCVKKPAAFRKPVWLSGKALGW